MPSDRISSERVTSDRVAGALHSIGSFARLTGFSVKTLRYYDEEGILKPAVVDGATGYRRYTEAQVEQARSLWTLRFLHLPVETLRAFMSDPTEEHRLAIFDRHIAQLQQEVAALNNRIRTMQRKRAHPWPEETYEVRVEVHPPVPFVFLHYQTLLMNIEEARALAFQEVRAYLAGLRVEPVGPPTCFSPPKSMHQDEQTKCEVYVGFEVTAPVPGEGRARCGWTPGGTWYVTRHHGLYEHTGFAFAALYRAVRGDGIGVRQGYGEFVTSEVFRTGPWDTPDLGKLMTDVRWLVRPEDLGFIGSGS